MSGDQSQRLASKMAAHMTGPVACIETHAAIILLNGDRAYKIKRPVKFSFLDFSTAAARKAALAHELHLNKRTAPAIYRHLVAVLDDGRISHKADAAAAEWALEMRAFDNAQRLDRIMANGLADQALFLELAAKIAGFHQALPPLDEPAQTQAMAEVVRGNAQDLRASIGKVFLEKDVEALIAQSEVELSRQTACLKARQHWVRHCHGDLHSENIIIEDAVPILFDCIEFNDAFAQIDVLYDLAFLVMDLLERGEPMFAWTVWQAYLDLLPQDSGLALMPLFLSIRAAIRAKVEAFAGHGGKAQTYLQFAMQALEPQPPRLIAIGGLSGTGKSTIAKRLAPSIGRMPGALHLRSDAERKRLFGVEFTKTLPPDAYTPETSRQVFEILNQRARMALQAGQSVIVDAVFAQPSQRHAIEAVANALNIPFFGIWLDLPLADRISRVEKRSGDVSDANAAVAAEQENYDVGQMKWLRLDSSAGAGEAANKLRHETMVS